jgi:ABC-type Na+ efflux pump permease subunit
MRLPFFLVSARKDFQRRLADPLAMASWLGIPLVIGSLLSLVMGGGGGLTPKAKLLFVDQDDSLVSKGLAGLATGGGADSMIELVPLELEEARKRIDSGEGSGMLVIPKGFGKAVLEDEPTQLHLLTNPAQRILPRILEEGLDILVEATFYGQQLFGDQLKLMSAGPPEGNSMFANAVIAAQAVTINQKIETLESTLSPPLLELEFDVVTEGEEKESSGSNPMTLLFPGMLFMSMLFIAQGMSADLWEEKESGTLRRIRMTPQSLHSMLLGKTLAATAISFGVTALGLLAGVALFDFPIAGFLPALIWGGFSGGALVPLFLWAQTLGSTPSAGNMMTSMVLFPMMMLGGSLFPMESMPDWMVEVGRWTPNGMALIEFKGLMTGTVEVASLLRSIVCLSVMSTVFFLLSARRTERHLLNA